MSLWDILPECIQSEVKLFTPHPLTKVLNEGINWIYGELKDDKMLRMITSCPIMSSNDYMEYFYSFDCSPNERVNYVENIFDKNLDFTRYRRRRAIYKKFLLWRIVWSSLEDMYTVSSTQDICLGELPPKIYSWRDCHVISKLVWKETQTLEYWLGNVSRNI